MRRCLHFITQPYSLCVIEPLAQLIEAENWGENLIFVAPKVRPFYNLPFPVCDRLSTAIDFQPDVVFVPGNVVYPRLQGIKVQIFHGLCEEKKGHYKITGFFDLYCTSGPLITARFQQLAQRKGYFVVRETGWPKIDRLLAPFNRTELAQRLGLPVEHKIVLYAPTFSPRFKSSRKMLTVIREMPRPDETWIIKLHDLMDPSERESFRRLACDRIRFYESPDNIPLLQVADVLISDTSSVVYEFMLLDKPVITLNARVRLEKGLNLTRIEHLRDALDRTFAQPDEFKEGREQALAAIHPYRDRQSSRRVLQAVEQFCNQNLDKQLRPKPRNLWRRWQVKRRMEAWL